MRTADRDAVIRAKYPDNAPDLARMVQDAGASAIAVHGRTAAQGFAN